jgi:threonine dehydrogenase-like Zn-dependent dehydrogenase
VLERFGLATVDPGRNPVADSRFSIAYECVGHSATIAAALLAIRPRGTVVFVGLAEEQIQIPATPLMVGERTIVGSSAYTMDDFRGVAAWIASGDDDLTPVIQLRVGLDDLPLVFERYSEGTLDALKTVVDFAG